MCRMSSSVWASSPAGAGLTPKSRVTALAVSCSSQLNGLVADLDQLERESDDLRDRLRLLERQRLGDELAEGDAEVGQDQERERVGDPVRERRVEVVGQERLPDRAQGDAEDGDPDLDRTDELDRMVHQVERRAGTTAAGLGVGLEPRSARGHERVFGRNEDRVPEHEQEDREDAEGVAHAPLSGARALEGSSSKLARSIGNDSDVLAPLRALFEDEPLEMGQRLGDGKPA